MDIDSASAFHAAIIGTLQQAVQGKAWRVTFVDKDYADWPLEDAALLEALVAFVRLPGRRVVLVGRTFDAVLRSCPRFVAWRRTWSHAVDACRPADDDIDLPTLLLVDRSSAVQLLDRVHWRGRALSADPRVHVLGEDVDAFVQRSEPTFGATTLGL